MKDYIFALLCDSINNLYNLEKSKMKLSDRIRVEKTILTLQICKQLLTKFIN